MHVASRTGSHAFPRDLRGSHPRDHGGNGEKVENGVAPGEGHAAQRERVGKSDECGGGVCVFAGMGGEKWANLSPGVMEKHEKPSAKFLFPACGRFSRMQLSLFESLST